MVGCGCVAQDELVVVLFYDDAGELFVLAGIDSVEDILGRDLARWFENVVVEFGAAFVESSGFQWRSESAAGVLKLMALEAAQSRGVGQQGRSMLCITFQGENLLFWRDHLGNDGSRFGREKPVE